MDYDFSKAQEYLKKNQRFINLLKFCVFFLSVYFIFDLVKQNFTQLKTLLSHQFLNILWLFVLESVVYVFLLFLLAQAWKVILESLSRKKLDKQIISIYVVSLLYKYLPGNVFHYASRHVAANKIGVKHKHLLLSNLYESVGLIFSALLCSISLTHTLNFIPIHVSLACFSALLTIAMFNINNEPVKIFFKSLVWYVIYFGMMGILSFYLIKGITNNADVSIFIATSLYAISWIAGYLLPGAPGGLGVRESIYILISSSFFDNTDAIIIITLLRVITTTGEVLAYALIKAIPFLPSGTSNE